MDHTALFQQAEPVLDQIVNKFVARHGGERDEIKGEAQMLYWMAFKGPYYQRWNPETCEFLQWIKYMVFRGLLTKARTMAIRKKSLPRVGLLDMPERERFDFDKFIDGLSPDAAKVAKLLVLPNANMKAALADRKYPESPSGMRRALLDVLDEFGWATEQIEQCFNEIREALCS